MIRPGQTSRFLIAALVAVLVCAAPAVAQTPQLVGGRNVNMTGGSQIISVSPFQVRGDVLGRAQNEPSCAMSTRNPQHILCGANDYRMVDVPGVTTSQIIRDAWLGEFQSINGGETWESTLAGGFFMNPAAHPLRQLGYKAAADAVVRSGPAGVTYSAGIAFTSDKSRSALHLTTYADLNNRENDEMPFKPVRTTVVALATGAKFIDKPWLYVEAGAPGATCSLRVPTGTGTPAGGTPSNWQQMLDEWVSERWPGWTPSTTVTQRVPASTVHLVYTVFLDSNDSTADIMYTRSENCGLTFSVPVKLSQGPQQGIGLNEHGNGAAIAKPLTTGSNRVYAAWRRVRLVTQNGTLPDAIMSVFSNDNGRTWSVPQTVSEICPFDQGTTATSFRHTAFPTMTADAAGRVYIAWSDRRQPDGTCIRTPSGAADGAARIRIASSTNGLTWTSSTAMPSETPEHQIFPTMAFTAGRLVLGWVDFSEDASQVFGQFINEADAMVNVPAIRHTGDVRAAMAMPAAAPDFGGGSSKISEYLRGKVVTGGQTVLGQIQWNAVNRRWARKGAVPFNGDYIDIGTLPYLPPLPGQTAWRPNNQATITTALGVVPNAPQVLFAWADNRDMRTGPDVDNPAVPVPYQTPNGLALAPQSAFDPTQIRPICTTGADSFKTGAHNQNTYSARASIGFLAAAPGNNKDLGAVTRAFVVYLRNDTGIAKSFRLLATPPPGGFASFHQFVTTLTVLDVNVPKRSSVARTIYVSRNPTSATPLNPDSSVRVDVVEMVGGAPVQAASVILNADPSAPEIEAPEIEAREIYTPEIEAPEIEAHTAGAPEIEAPEIEAPEIEAPEIEAAAWKALGLQRPEIEAPEIEALEIEAPEIEAPEIEATAITDISLEITNTGNTTAQYNAKAFVNPRPGSDFHYQVIVRRRYELPAVDINCEPTTIALSKVAVNLPDVALGTPEIEAPEIEAPEIEAAGIATFYLEPGAKAQVTIRARSISGQVLDLEDVDLAVEPPVDSDDAALGITKPETKTTYLTVATAVLPAGRIGTPYLWTLEASGNDGGVAWDLVSGALPTGIVLTPGGLLTGTPTVAGTFSFRVRATDALANSAERDLTLVVTSGAASLAFVTQPTSTAVGQVIAPAVSVKAFTAAGLPAAGVVVTLTRVDGFPLLGTLVRTTGPTGIAVFENLALPATAVVLHATAPGYAATDSIAFNAGLPDLVTLISMDPLDPTSDDEIEFTFAVTNAGTAAAGPSMLAIWLPSAYAIEGPATFVPVPALAVGGSYVVTRTDGPLSAGEHTVSATADTNDLVWELNDGNNDAWVDFGVDGAEGAGATATIYDSPTAFALATNAASATGVLPNYGELVGPVQVGGVQFQPGPDGDYVYVGGGALVPDWYPNLPGHDIAMGLESLTVRFFAPINEFGFYFVEPNATMPLVGGSPVDSLYRVRFYQFDEEGEIQVGETTFNAPDDEVVFIGLHNPVEFDFAVIDDLSGSDDDEYFGEFYVDYGDVVGTFVVTNNDNDGAGSLRAAIEAAEAQPGKNQIVFDIDGEGRTIQLETNLPDISDGESILIDATTQPGFSGRPTVELRQNPDSSELRGLHLEASSSLVRGLIFSEFDAAALLVGGTGNLIVGNWFGLSSDGDTALGNPAQGVLVEGAAFTTIGGAPALARNVFAGNDVGIEVGVGSSATSIIGNYVGTEATGTEARPNVTGVKLWSNGGFNDVTGNVISGNSGDGLSVLGSNNNVIRGNTIGLDASGGSALPNFHGVVFVADEGSSVGNILGGLNAGEGNVISGHASANVLVGNLNSGTVIQGNIIGSSAFGAVLTLAADQQFGINITGATGTQVGGAVPGARNIIVGVDYAVQALGATGTNIEGNYIGTFDGVVGFGPVGEWSSGVFVEGGIGVRVGGATAAHGNVIGNVDTGVTLISGDGETTSMAVVANNRFGLGLDDVTPLPIGTAVAVVANGSGVVINSAIELNTFANVSGRSVAVIGDGATQSIIRRNSFGDVVAWAIDLGDDGVTVNDLGDTDTGPNNRQNHPVFSAVTPNLVAGSISSAPSTEYILDLYLCSAGQPRSYGTTINVTTNGSGDAFFNLGFGGLPGPVAVMATDSLGNSSEISDCHVLDSGHMVTNTNDAGPGSLRDAIIQANLAFDESRIYFNIPGWPHTITPATPLPVITSPVIIDARSQPGYDGTPAIELNGALVEATFLPGLVFQDHGNRLYGLAINRFRHGLRLDSSDNNFIQGNFIGTDRTGTADLGNTSIGIIVDGSSNVIGSTEPSLRNVISGNNTAGISFQGASTSDNLLLGNYIGLGANGATPIGNGFYGVLVLNSASNTTIGGDTGWGNVISGQTFYGVYVSGATNTQIRGNRIGTDAMGLVAVGNDYGVIIEDAVPSITDNVISGNAAEAVTVRTIGSTSILGGTISNNKIGVGSDGSTPVGNGKGILVESGGSAAIQSVSILSNIIANNGAEPIHITGDSATRISVLGNSIYGNSEPFELANNGPDVNDFADGDSGPNLHQNYPVITLASPATGVIEGSLSSTPNTDFRIQVFKSAVCGATRQGQTLLVDTVLTTDGSGLLTFSNGGLTFNVGDGITATATDEDDNTSEFSACFSADAGSLTTLGFEDQLNEFAEADFPATYRGITWTGWKHKAPYSPIEVAPDGVNAVYAATGDARFTFPTSFFLGAWFSVPILNPDLTNPPNDQLYLEVYYLGELVHTSAAITGATGGLVFLSAFYPGPADEVRVITTGVAMMTPAGSAWIMDNVEFDPGS